MKRYRPHKSFPFLLIWTIVFSWANFLFAQSSANYDIWFDVISGGGGYSGSTNYDLYQVIGQASAVGVSWSTNYRDRAGFLNLLFPDSDTTNPVFPAEGTIGTMITISGSGFGAKKGKVLLEREEQDSNTGELKKITASLKVVKDGWMDTQIKATVSKALPGVYDVTILPKGGQQIVHEASFSVKKPQIERIDPTDANYETAVTVYGKYFGNKQGRISLSHVDGVSGFTRGWKCGIVKGSWIMDPVTGESEATFIVPCGLKERMLDVSLLPKIRAVGIKANILNKIADTKECPISEGKTNICPPECGW